MAGNNKIVLKQFELGEKVDNPNAMSLPQREQLMQLANALEQRPALQLEVPGGYNRTQDVPALQSLDVAAMLEAELGQPDGGEPEQLLRQTRRALERLARDHDLFGESSPRKLRKTFERALDDGTTRFDEVAYMEELRDRLARSQRIDDARLDTLAENRRAAIMTALTASGLNAGRLHEADIAESKTVDDTWVRLQLVLEVGEIPTAALETPGAENSAPAAS